MNSAILEEMIGLLFLLGTVPSNPKVTGDQSPVSPVVVTRLVKNVSKVKRFNGF